MELFRYTSSTIFLSPPKLIQHNTNIIMRPFLPFLYETNTILRADIRRTYASDAFGEITTFDLKRQAQLKISQNWSKVNRSPTRQSRRTPVESSSSNPTRINPQRRTHLPPPSPASSTPREWIEHVPFEGIPARPTSILDRLKGQTMTRHEFNVFKDILAKGATAESAAAAKEAAEREKEDRRKRRRSIDSTGRAKGLVRERVEMPELLRPLAEEAESISMKNQREREERERAEEEEEARRREKLQVREDQKSVEYLEKMKQAMDDAGTDAELWEVFYKTLQRDIESALSAIDVEEKEGKINLTTLTTTLPQLLLHMTTLLRSTFPGSPYLLSLLPTLRNMGPSAFTLGATTNLYNSHIRCLFETYGDLQGIVEMLQEMESDVFEFDEGTSAVLEDIFERAEKAERGEFGSAVKMLWASERRVRELEELERWEKVVAERRARAEARRVEARGRRRDVDVEEEEEEQEEQEGKVRKVSGVGMMERTRRKEQADDVRTGRATGKEEKRRPSRRIEQLALDV